MIDSASPTRRQRRPSADMSPMGVLRYIAGYQEARGGVSPFFREIAEGCGFSPKSKQAVTTRLNELEKMGVLRRLPLKEQAIELLAVPAIPRAPDGAPLYFVPVGQPTPPGQGAE